MKIIELFKALHPEQTLKIETTDSKKQLVIDCNDCGRYGVRDVEESKYGFVGVMTLAELEARCESLGYNADDWEICKTREELKLEIQMLEERLKALCAELENVESEISRVRALYTI